MTGNFHPEIVQRAVELTASGEINPGAMVRPEFPQLTWLGVDRVVDAAWREIAEQHKGGSAA